MDGHYRIQASCHECGHYIPLLDTENILAVACPRCGGDLEIFKAEQILLA